MLFILISILICFYFLFTEKDAPNMHKECSTLAFFPPDIVPHPPHFPTPKEPKQPS